MILPELELAAVVFLIVVWCLAGLRIVLWFTKRMEE